MSRAAALTKAAAAVSLAALTTSFPTLYASTLSYFEKVLIVAIYESSKLVVHAGFARSMEPFTGSVRSMLGGV